MTSRDTPGGVTPGPWKLWQATSDHSLNVVNEKSEFICEVGVLGKDGDARNARIKADANLIAAAPDLLAALEKAKSVIDGLVEQQAMADYWWQTDYADILTAIKKARGA